MAVALSLATPRLWILIKAFILWVCCLYRCHGNQQNIAVTPMPIPLSSLSVSQTQIIYQNHPAPLSFPESLIVTEQSRSELGAARDLLRYVWAQLASRAIHLQESSGFDQRLAFCKYRLPILWSNFRQPVVDIATSLILSLIFIGIFVAESSGSVLSAGIVSDNVALSTSLHCKTRAQYSHQGDIFGAEALQPFSYSDQCYGAEDAADGCNYFYNQSLSFTERHNDECPFDGDVCLRGSNSAYTLDTGQIEAKYLGINSAKRYQFRRSTTCAPVVTDGYMKEGIISGGRRAHLYYYGQRHTFNRDDDTGEDTWHTIDALDNFTEPSFAVG